MILLFNRNVACLALSVIMQTRTNPFMQCLMTGFWFCTILHNYIIMSFERNISYKLWKTTKRILSWNQQHHIKKFHLIMIIKDRNHANLKTMHKLKKVYPSKQVHSAWQNCDTQNNKIPRRIWTFVLRFF